MDKSYKYLGYFFLLLIPLTIAGFYKTYIVQFPNFKENITYFIHIHAFIATVWIGILILQPFLIVNKKFALHRKVGKCPETCRISHPDERLRQRITLFSRNRDPKSRSISMTARFRAAARRTQCKRSAQRHRGSSMMIPQAQTITNFH